MFTYTDMCFRYNEEMAANTANSQPRDIEMKEMGASKPNDDNKDTPNVEVKQPTCKKKKARLFWAMTKTFWFKCLVAAIFKFIFDLLQFVSPLILK